MDTLWVTSILLLAASGLSFYALSRVFYGRLASAACALLYIFLPYHMLNLYWRGAVPEFAAFAVAPLVILFASRLGQRARALDYAGLALSFAALLLIHSPSAYLMTCVLGLYSLLLCIETRSFRPVVRIAGAAATGLLVGAIYWVPAALEAKYAHENISTLYPYERSYLPRHAWPEAFWQALTAALAAQLILLSASPLVLWYVSWRRRRRPSGGPVGADDSVPADGRITAKATIRTHSIIAIIALLMTTIASAPIAKLLPKIELVAFAFRWLMPAGVFVSLVTAAAADRLVSHAEPWLLKRCSAAALLAAAAAINAGVTIECVMVWAAANAPLQVPNQLIESNYTPRDAARPETLPGAPQAAFGSTGGSAVEIERWDPQYRKIHEESSIQNMLKLRTYYFPGWSAKIDGNSVPLQADSSGIQFVATPPGSHTIEVYMDDTPARILGKALSLTGLMIIVLSPVVMSHARSRGFEEQHSGSL